MVNSRNRNLQRLTCEYAEGTLVKPAIVKHSKHFAAIGSVLCPWLRPSTASKLAVFLALVCYCNSLWGSFVLDDEQAIVRNLDLRPEQPLYSLLRNDFWGSPMAGRSGHKSYRPLTVLTFRLNYWLGGLDPLGYHLVNVILHAAATALFAAVCSGMRVPPLLPATLFAVHPVHTEAVSNVVGRAELLAAVLFFLALLCYRRAICAPRYASSLGSAIAATTLAAAAMLAKEQGVTALGVCAAYDVFFGRARICTHPAAAQRHASCSNLRQAYRLAILVVAGGACLGARLYMNTGGAPDFAWDQNPASFATEWTTRAMSYSYIYALNAWLLIFPYHLCCDWSDTSIPLVTTITDLRNVASLLLFGGLVGLLYVSARKPISSSANARAPIVGMSLALMVLPFLPASNLFFRVGFVVAERLLYLPSAGACLAFALGVDALDTKMAKSRAAGINIPACRVALRGAVVGLVALHALRTVSRNNAWHSSSTLFAADVATNPRNPKLWYNMGLDLANRGYVQQAEWAYRSALQVRSTHLSSLHNLGLILKRTSRVVEAERIFRSIIAVEEEAIMNFRVELRLNSQRAAAANNLAILLQEHNPDSKHHHDEALQLLQWAVQIHPDDYDSRYNLGLTFLKGGEGFAHLAKESLLKALQLNQNSPDVLASLGLISHQEGDVQRAIELYRACLQLQERADVRANLDVLLG